MNESKVMPRIDVIGQNGGDGAHYDKLDVWEKPDRIDMVNSPPHYTKHPSGVECISVTEHMNFCIGNAMKYLWRADLKNGVEDLEKCVWYVNREIERRKKMIKSSE